MLNEDPSVANFEPGNNVYAQINNAVHVEGRDAIKALKEILYKKKAQDDELMAEINSILEDTDSDMVSTLTLDQLGKEAEINSILEDTDSDMVSTLTLDQLEKKAGNAYDLETKIPVPVHENVSDCISGSPFSSRCRIIGPEPTLMNISTLTTNLHKAIPSATVTSGDLEREEKSRTGTKLVKPVRSHQLMYKSKASSRNSAPASNRSGSSKHYWSKPVPSSFRQSVSVLDQPGSSKKAKFVRKKLCEMTDEQRERVRVRRRQKIRALSKSALSELQHIPTLNRPIRTVPYQPIGSVPLSDNEDFDDEEIIPDPYTRTVQDRPTPSARSEPDWKLVYYNEKTAREFSEWTISFENPVTMPVQTLAETRIKMRVGCYVATIPTQEVYEFKVGTEVTEQHEAVQTFLTEVEIYKYCSFDTEGNGQLLDRFGKRTRLFFALSTPFSATILLFHDVNDIPDAIRCVLMDYTVAKIQSGIGGDIKLMDEHGLKVRGLVDSGTLYMLVKPALIDAGFGAKHQIEVIWPQKQYHQAYEWKSFGDALDRQKLPTKLLRHIIQDVLTPYGILYKAAIMRAEDLGMSEDDDVFPIANEALELCYSKSPRDVRQHPPSRNPQSYWYPQEQESEFMLISREQVTLI